MPSSSLGFPHPARDGRGMHWLPTAYLALGVLMEGGASVPFAQARAFPRRTGSFADATFAAVEVPQHQLVPWLLASQLFPDSWWYWFDMSLLDIIVTPLAIDCWEGSRRRQGRATSERCSGLKHRDGGWPRTGARRRLGTTDRQKQRLESINADANGPPGTQFTAPRSCA